MLVIICPRCHYPNEFGTDEEDNDDDDDIEICKSCGCNYAEFEDEEDYKEVLN